MTSIYTRSERTVAKYTVGKAVALAKAQLRGEPYCANALRNRSLSDLITLEEVNDLADEIVLDTHYYNNGDY